VDREDQDLAASRRERLHGCAKNLGLPLEVDPLFRERVGAGRISRNVGVVDQVRFELAAAGEGRV
jgi:hypothetical protein